MGVLKLKERLGRSMIPIARGSVPLKGASEAETARVWKRESARRAIVLLSHAREALTLSPKNLALAVDRPFLQRSRERGWGPGPAARQELRTLSSILEGHMRRYPMPDRSAIPASP